jgi:hypothetical protein
VLLQPIEMLKRRYKTWHIKNSVQVFYLRLMQLEHGSAFQMYSPFIYMPEFLGMPFYAGWGLTTDLQTLPRVNARPDLLGLIYACLINYPCYFDPIAHLAYPPEVVIERLNAGSEIKTGAVLRMLAKLQGAFASRSHWWR